MNATVKTFFYRSHIRNAMTIDCIIPMLDGRIADADSYKDYVRDMVSREVEHLGETFDQDAFDSQWSEMSAHYLGT